MKNGYISATEKPENLIVYYIFLFDDKNLKLSQIINGGNIKVEKHSKDVLSYL